MKLRANPVRSSGASLAIPPALRSRSAILLTCVTFVGCTAIDETIERDAERVAADVRQRIAIDADLARLSEDRSSIESRVHDWIAQPLSLESTVRIALLQAPSLRTTLADLGIARAETIQAGLLSNPAFSANAKFFSEGIEVELGITQSLLDVFLIPVRRQVASARYAAIEATVTREIVHIAHEARRNYFAVQAGQALERLAQAKVESARASLELMQRLHDAGNVTDAMLTEQVIALAEAELEGDRVHLETLEVRADFDLALGLRGEDTHWTITADLPPDPLAALDLSEIEARAVASSLDLAVVNAEIEAAGISTTLARRQSIVPDLTAGIASKRESGGETGLGPTLGFALPIFDDGSARVAAGELRRQRRLHEQISIATRIEIESRRLRDRLTTLAERARDLSSAVVPAHARHVREILQQYNAMQIGAFTVLEARHAELDAQRDALIALRDAWLARIDLEELMEGALLR